MYGVWLYNLINVNLILVIYHGTVRQERRNYFYESLAIIKGLLQNNCNGSAICRMQEMHNQLLFNINHPPGIVIYHPVFI